MCGPTHRWEILRWSAYIPLDLKQHPTYAMDSPLSARWFEADHEERWAGIEAHLEALDDNDVDYKA
jgi:hypothetical protein